MLLYTLHKREVDRSRKPINRGKEKPESKPNNIPVIGIRISSLAGIHDPDRYLKK